MTTLMERASALARDMRDAQIDHNEAQKALAYLRINRDGKAYFAYLQAIVQNGKVVIRSQQTMKYYRDLLELSRRHLRNLPPEDMTATLAWAIRLLRYYKKVPEPERQSLDTTPAASHSASQSDITRSPTGAAGSSAPPATSGTSSTNRKTSSTDRKTIPQQGEIFVGKVLEVGEDAVLIQVHEFSKNRVVGVMKATEIPDNNTSRYRQGGIARVEVIEVTQKNARTILELRPAPKQK